MQITWHRSNLLLEITNWSSVKSYDFTLKKETGYGINDRNSKPGKDFYIIQNWMTFSIQVRQLEREVSHPFHLVHFLEFREALYWPFSCVSAHCYCIKTNLSLHLIHCNTFTASLLLFVYVVVLLFNGAAICEFVKVLL